MSSFYSIGRIKITLKNSLINHKRVVSVYVIQIHVDLHKL